jgi:hypothetical protein
MRLRLKEGDLVNLVKLIIEQEENDEYVKVSPDDFLKMLRFSSYNIEGLGLLPKFRGKKIWITGNLDVSNSPIDNLGSIKRIEGNLDISNTQIGDVSNISVDGNIRDYDSKRHKLKLAAELRQKRSEADERRQSGEWDIENTDDVGLKANALFQWLEGNGDIETLSGEEKEELTNLEVELSQLKEIYDSDELEPDEVSELYDKMTEIEERIEELTSKNADVYDIVESRYGYYDMTSFEVLSLHGREYAVGTEDELENSAIEYAKQLIDDVGMGGFRTGFIDEYINENALRDYIYDFYEYDIRENAESYFDEDDFKLTDEQEERKDQLEDYIYEMEDLKSKLEDEQSKIEDSDSDEYIELQDKLDEIEENIDTAQSELDDIVPDTDPTEEMIEEKIQDFVNDRMRDAIGFIKEFDLNLEDFIDEDELAKGYVEADGYGILSSYDGSYDSINLNGEVYYIVRTG